jgi:cysteine desulfurase / selenocysteine lyase
MIDVRSDFPALIAHPDLIIFDNAATALKPRSVIDAWSHYITHICANVGRGSHSWGRNATREYESVREQVATFIHAVHADEVIFTSGSTAGMNMIAQGWGLHNL